MNVTLSLLNFFLSTAMWLILGRLLLRVFIRNQQNPVWQMFLVATEPVYRVSRVMTGNMVSEGWLWLVSLAWLMAARIVVTGFHTALAV